MLTQSFSKTIARTFVEIVDEIAENKGYTKGEFAALVWPECTPKLARNRWSAIRNKAPATGKAQGVLIEDALLMAEVLGENVGWLLGKAIENAARKEPAPEGSKKEAPRRRRRAKKTT